MIEQINSLKNFGIFKHYQANSEIYPFSKFNIFYGWNGSGKSTISRLFASFSKRCLPVGHSNCQFDVSVTGNRRITENNISDCSEKIAVFNQDFIDENINWNDCVNSILLVSEEKIDDRKQLNEYTIEHKKLIEEIGQVEENSKKLKEDIDKFLSGTAKAIKEKFQILDTTDSFYLNYNKTKLQSRITQDIHTIESGCANLSEEETINLTTAIKPDVKPVLEFRKNILDYSKILLAVANVKELLARSLVTKTIDRLKENEDIGKWVEEGLVLHQKHGSETCEFCGQVLPTARIEDLQAHFSNAFTKLKEELGQKESELKAFYIVNQLPDSANLYTELVANFTEKQNQLITITKSINDSCQELVSCIKSKTDNPFTTICNTDSIAQELIQEYNQLQDDIATIIEKHNVKTNDFENVVKKNKEKLELHYASEACNDFTYFEKCKTYEGLLSKKIELEKKSKELGEKVIELETSLANETLGAVDFNGKLHRFLGHKDISLQFDKDAHGYRIIRHNVDVAKNLSEGEKTAIAFLYFITKLKEKDSKIEDTIVVIDDPISSFDSNHVFNAYSFLKNYCKEALQLFVFTHNYGFYVLLRDWLYKKNKPRENKILTRIYTVEVTQSEDRQSTVKNANKTLTDYNSEYHYVFKQIHSFISKPSLTLDEAFLIGNLSRKLLEGFMSFKYPKSRNNREMTELISDKIKGERIYKFINQYSHHDRIGFGEPMTDNLLSESYNVVTDLMDTIEEMDKTHYDEMMAVING
ncbi:MAG: hypothetical protein H6Q72_2711 [Firmicutes bacterium]|nr:hypothetical protein [Bacillota bacterium]